MTKPRIQIVDKDDKLVGHVKRSEIDYDTQIYRITAIWVTNSKREVLIAQRTMSKDKDPGMWGPAAAGTMDEGETYEENVYKEAFEELGIKDQKFTLGPKVFFESPRMCFCQWYYFETDKQPEDFVLQEEEVDQVAWISLDDLQADVTKNPEKYVPSMQFNIDTHTSTLT